MAERVAALHGPRDLRIEEREAATEPGPGEVLVAVRVSGLCGTDLHEYIDGPRLTAGVGYARTAEMPVHQVLGHEFSGVIVAAHPSLDVEVGSAVAVNPNSGCGTCEACRAGLSRLCVDPRCMGLNSKWGGLQEFVCVPASRAVLLPDGVSLVEGALIEPAAVAYNAVSGVGDVGGNRVLVVGGGAVGHLVALVARALGAGEVVVCEINEVRRARVSASEFNAIKPDELRSEFPAHFDLAFECSGSAAGAESALASLRPMGLLTLVAETPLASVSVRDIFARELKVKGAFAYEADAFTQVVRLLRSGDLPVSKCVSKVAPFSEVLEVFEHLSAPHNESKVLIEIGAGVGS